MKITIGTRIVIDIADTTHDTRVFVDDRLVGPIAGFELSADARQERTKRCVEFIIATGGEPEPWAMDAMRDAGFTVTVTDIRQGLEGSRVYGPA